MADTEREAFEAWNDSLGQESFGIRSVPNLPPAAWAAWQARAALASRLAEVDDELRKHGDAMSSWLYGLSYAALPFDSWAKKCAELSSKWDEVAAPSHTTNKEK